MANGWLRWQANKLDVALPGLTFSRAGTVISDDPILNNQWAASQLSGGKEANTSDRLTRLCSWEWLGSIQKRQTFFFILYLSHKKRVPCRIHSCWSAQRAFMKNSSGVVRLPKHVLDGNLKTALISRSREVYHTLRQSNYKTSRVGSAASAFQWHGVDICSVHGDIPFDHLLSVVFRNTDGDSMRV